MTPNEALVFITSLVQQISMPFAGHLKAAEAIRVLELAISQPPSTDTPNGPDGRAA